MDSRDYWSKIMNLNGRIASIQQQMLVATHADWQQLEDELWSLKQEKKELQAKQGKDAHKEYLSKKLLGGNNE